MMHALFFLALIAACTPANAFVPILLRDSSLLASQTRSSLGEGLCRDPQQALNRPVVCCAFSQPARKKASTELDLSAAAHPICENGICIRRSDCSLPLPAIKHGDTVRISFVGKTEDGEVVRTSSKKVAFALAEEVGPQPITEEFTIGRNQASRAIEEAVLGMQEGDMKKVTLAPKDAFGEKDEDLIYTITKSMVGVPDDMPVALGTSYRLKGGKQARVVEVEDEWLVLDANHALAGRHITFNIQIDEIVPKSGSGRVSLANMIPEVDFLEDC